MYGDLIANLNRDLKEKKELQRLLKRKYDLLEEAQSNLVDLQQAQQLLATVSDDNTEATLNYVTSIINKALTEIFKSDTRKVRLVKKLHAGTKPHIIVELENGKGEQIDLALQSGTGLRQVVSVLFVVCLIEIRKGRRLVMLDERLSGLHKEAKRILSEIFKIFAEGGFQFIFVEYSLNTIGKIYNVEKPGDIAKVFALDGQEYSDDDIFLFSEEADLTALDKDYSEDYYEW